MKSILIVLLVLVAVSSVQARNIPIESIVSYINESMNTSQELRQKLEPTDFEDMKIAINLFPKFQETSPDIVHAKYYYELLAKCGMSEPICSGLGQVCSDLSRKVNMIKLYLPEIKEPAFALQVKEVITYLEQFIEDIIDNIPSEECRKYVRDGQWVED